MPFCRESQWNCRHHSFLKKTYPTLLRHLSPGLKILSALLTEYLKHFFGKRVTFCVSRKASLTVEAALVLPIFFFAVLTLMNLMEICRLQGVLNMSLCDSARKLGTYGYIMPGKEENTELLLGTASCILFARNQLPEEVLEAGTVTFLGSRYEDKKIYLQTQYRVKTGVPFFLSEVRIPGRAQVRSWEGDTETERENGEFEEMVFVTEHGDVYHVSSSCRHLKVTISSVTKRKAETMRNVNGEKYTACEKCIGHGEVNNLVYVTESGNRFHNMLTCSGLKRSVKLIKKSEAAGYPPCSNCRGMEEKGAA